MGVYNGKTGDQWRSVADDYYYEYKRTGDDWYLSQYRSATLKASIADDNSDSSSSSSSSSSGSYGKKFTNSTNGITITGSSGADTITSNGGNVKIYGNAGNDTIGNYRDIGGSRSAIYAGDGNDSVANGQNYSTLDGGNGNDYIYNDGNYVTITGGKGSDTIQNNGTSGYGENVLFKYASGDGNDKILDFKSNSTLSVSGASYSSAKSGSDIIVNVGDGRISLIGAASLSAVNIKGKKISTETNSWTLDGTTATYGDLITVKGVKSLDGINLSGTTVTISKSSLGTSKVTISDGYTLKLADDVTKPTTKQSWSLSNSTATYKQTTTAGYSIADNVITYNKKSTKTLATVTGVKSTKGLSVSGNVVTVAKASLNAKKVTISDGYTLALSDDVDEPTTKKAAWTLKSSTATYKSSGKTAGYILASNGKSIIYSKATTASTLATVKGVKSTGGLKVSGEKITLKKSALNSKVTVSGDYEFDFASDYSKATITGSKNSDLITVRGKKFSINGGAGDDTIKILGSGTVTGGDGADTFYLKSSVANVITDYAEEDKISLASGNANVSISGDDVIFNGKITISGGADKKITYIDASGENIYSKSADDYKVDGKTVTILDNYTKESFDITNENSIQTIDASAAQLGLTITGNKLKNKIIGSSEDDIIYGLDAADTILGEEGNDKIYGGKGNDKIYGGNGDDSLWGDAGTDTLIGGDGADTFIYKNGDNKIIIDDFDDSLDKIRVMSGDVNNPYTAGGDVIFEVGSGQIVIKNSSDKFIPIYYGKGNNNVVQRYRGN